MALDLHAVVLFFARILLASVFLWAGVLNFINVRSRIDAMAAMGVPAAPFVLVAGIALELVCAVLLVLNLWAGWAALALFVFTAVATALFHDFWNKTDSGTRHGELSKAMHNLSIMGGLLVMAAFSL